MLLEINDLRARIADGGKEILKGLSLRVNPGEVHAIMGANGSGKSSLANILVGHEGYEVTSGTVNFLGHDLLGMDPETRARNGLFLAFQYPVELPGVNESYFLRTALNSVRSHRGQRELSVKEFYALAREKAKLVELPEEFLNRSVNEGFSGGEKKRNEIFQMSLLEPRLAILDETDSGLDIDALRVVSSGVSKLRGSDRGIVLITHYQRLLEYIKPDFVHVLLDGRIVRSGCSDLAVKLEEQGYGWLKADGAVVN